MISSKKANDWEIAGIAQVGGADVVGAGVYFFEFRSKAADFRGQFIFIGGGLGLGGSVGGASMPAPGDFVCARAYSPFSSLRCDRDFSADDLDLVAGRITSAGASFAYGYSVVRVTAFTNALAAGPGLLVQAFLPTLFHSFPASGWGTGVGASVTVFSGIWKKIGGGGYR